MCGSTEIDGYVFCLGLKSLLHSHKLAYTAFPDLQSLPSLIDLIERAGLRPKHITNSPDRYSLGIRPLPELLDMFRTRQASNPLDKVYALLGMSSDNPSEAGLHTNYNLSVEKLFQQLVNFILGKDASVETSSQGAVIKSKGCILGQVSSVKTDDRQIVSITSRRAASDSTSKDVWTAEWILQVSAKPIQERDIICLLHGASKPTIVRLCKDHFAVVVMAVTPLDESGSFGWPETSQFSRDFLLIWDWEKPLGESQDQDEYKTLTRIYSQVPKYSKAGCGNYVDDAIILWNDIMILDDLGEHKNADERLLEARNGYVAAFGKEHMIRTNSQYSRTLLSFVAGEGQRDIVKLLLDTIDQT